MATDNSNLDSFLGVKPVPAWRKWLKWIVGGAVLLVLLLLLSRCFLGSEQAGYATAEVKRDTLKITVSATGNLAPTNEVEVGSEISGLITRVLVDVNDRVTQGQTIAIIDPSRLEDEVRQGEAQVNANIAAVRQAEATVAETRATLARMEEVRGLSNGRVPSQTEMDTARANVNRAIANLNAARANVIAAQASLSSSRTQLTKTVIRSPVNGVVLARQIEPGQTVAASFSTPTLFVIAEDLSQMKLEVAVDEADVAGVRTGLPANFTVDAFPGRSFPAQITRVDVGSNQTVSSSASSSSSSSSSASVVSYAATLSVDNARLELRPGMTATAEITTVSRPNVLVVPNAALRFTPSTTTQTSSSSGGFASAIMPRPRRTQTNGGRNATTGSDRSQQTVYILGNDGKPQAVQVTVGATNGTVTEITGGNLRAGAQVITGQLSSTSSSSNGGQ